jgi:hypothetical protein
MKRLAVKQEVDMSRLIVDAALCSAMATGDHLIYVWQARFKVSVNILLACSCPMLHASSL